MVTAQAGPGLLATDRLRARGVRMPELDAATRQRLGELLPPMTYQRNPVDTARPDERFGEVVATVQRDPGIDAALVYALHEPGALDPVDLLRPAAANPSAPLLLVTGGPREEVDRLREVVEAGAVPVLTGPERGAAAMRALVADAAAAHRRRAAAGERRPPALGPAVVVKILDAAITHKTEVGGVHVGVEARPALEAALDAIDRLAVPGAARYLVEELLPPGIDLIVGAVRDPSFGPAVLVGLGSVVAEALADTAVRLAPLSAGDGHEMLEELLGRRLLDGFRGGPRVDRDELVTVLRRVGELLAAHPEITELDVNPLRATGDALVAADALIILDRADR